MTRTPPAANDQRCVVLLRGVNVGRAKRIAMADFTALLADLGATDIRTVLNSGNAVCTSPVAPSALATAVASAITDTCGFSCDVIVRTGEQLELTLDSNPLASVATNPSRHLVFFLGSTPHPTAVDRRAELDVSPEVWALDGAELHAWLPPGVADSRLAAALSKNVLGVTWTGRNWSTVEKLHSVV